MTRTFRLAVLLCLVGLTVAALSGSSFAQGVNLAFGLSTITAPGASNADSNHSPVSLTGGAYPGFSGDVQFLRHFGVGAELFWRASQGDYAGQGLGYRPIFWNINAVYSPRLGKHAALELVGGIGALSTRYYVGQTCGAYSCSNYQSFNHFDGDFGGGIKLYAHSGFFVRPEARVYLIHNNAEFSSNFATRYGVSVGYTFGGNH